MPEITTPAVVAHANNRVRPLADKLIAARRAVLAFREEYTDQNIGTLISNAGEGNLIADGSQTDGRPRMLGSDVWNMKTLCDDLNTFFTAERVAIIDKAMGNGG